MTEKEQKGTKKNQPGEIAEKVKSYPSFAKASVFAKATPDRMEDKKVKSKFVNGEFAVLNFAENI